MNNPIANAYTMYNQTRQKVRRTQCGTSDYMIEIEKMNHYYETYQCLIKEKNALSIPVTYKCDKCRKPCSSKEMPYPPCCYKIVMYNS